MIYWATAEIFFKVVSWSIAFLFFLARVPVSFFFWNGQSLMCLLLAFNLNWLLLLGIKELGALLFALEFFCIRFRCIL
jgi:hypothetical protein